jgi:glycosyltransferase involved in cell wall biosynthesis
MPQLRILYPFEFGTLMGGGQHSLLDLIADLDPGRFQAVVVCPPVGDLMASASARGAVTVPAGAGAVWVFSPRRIFRTCLDAVAAIFRIVRTLRLHRIRLVHANNIPAFLYSVAARALTGSTLPVIWHDRGFGQYPNPLWKLARWVLNQRPNYHLVCTTSGCADVWVQRGVNPSRMSVIYNGISTERFSPASVLDAKAALGLDGRSVIGMAARSSRNKGHSVLLRALARVRDSHPDAVALFIGGVGTSPDDAVYQKELSELAEELHVSGQVIWAGPVSNDRLPGFLAACDIVVNPSFHEAFGRVIAEAMLMAKPVIATRAGGAPELIEEGLSGYLIDPGDDHALAGRITALLNHPEHGIAIGAAAARRARALFDVTDTTHRIEQLYSQLLTSSARQHVD